MNEFKSPSNYVSRIIVFRKIKTGYELKKILLNVTDYKTVHELNNFYKTKWIPFHWFKKQLIEKREQVRLGETIDLADVRETIDWVLSLLEEK